MARKSNKTSHVLNLLAGGDTPPEEVKETPAVSEADDAAETEALSKPSISVIDTTGADTDPVADIIKQRLQEDEEEPVPETLADDIKETVTESFVGEEPEEMSLPVAPEKKNVTEAANESAVVSVPLPEAEKSEEPIYDYVNIMERIVRDKVIYFVREFNMCDCDRCVIDITALALTNLPPKYIVVDRTAISPLLNYYTNKFISRVTVEVTKACMVVKEFPHH